MKSSSIRSPQITWRLGVRLVQLYVGLIAFGLSAALLVRARFGLDPWDVLHQGLAKHLHIAIGTVAILVGAVVLLAWIPLRQRPGLGTISNVIVVGLAINVGLDVIPYEHQLVVRLVELIVAVPLCAVATGMYIGAEFGPGPRDGLMTGISRKYGFSIRVTRATIELTVLAAGWLWGGTVGIGTVYFALAIGPMVHVTLPLFSPPGADLPYGEAD